MAYTTRPCTRPICRSVSPSANVEGRAVPRRVRPRAGGGPARTRTTGPTSKPEIGDHLLDAPRGVDAQHRGPVMVEPSEPGRLAKAIPVLPSSDVDATMAYYRTKLGFEGMLYGSYLIMWRDEVHLHFALSGDHDVT